MIIDQKKRESLVGTLKEWTRHAKQRGTSSALRLPFKEFRKVICQIRNAAISIPMGKGLLSISTTLASKEDQQYVFIRFGSDLYQELSGWKDLLREGTSSPTKCTQLVTGHPDGIGIVDASKEGVGGIVVGENMPIVPTVFRLEWPEEVRELVMSDSNPNFHSLHRTLGACTRFQKGFIRK